MKKGILLVVVMGLSLTALCQTADSIIARYVAFIGGEKHWKAITTIVSSGTYDYGGIKFPFTSYSKSPDLYKYVVPLKGKYFMQAYDGKIGWKVDGFKGEKKKTLLKGQQAKEMLNEADVNLEPVFVDFARKGYTASLEGKDTVSGKGCFKIRLDTGENPSATYFFDAETGALLKKVAQSTNPELNKDVVEIYYSDYRRVNGIRLPFKTISKSGVQTILVIQVKQVQVNVPLANSIFTF
jgi:hypothetical protein